MSDDKKKQLTPRQEILPPERKPGISPLKPHNPSGVIDAVASGFSARAKARSIEANNGMRAAQLKNIELSTEIAYALKRNIIAYDELANIDAILESEHRHREYNALVARIRAEHEITRLEHETMELEIKTEELRQKKRRQAQEIDRENQRAASLDAEERWHNLEAEEQARGHFTVAQRDRLMAETISAAIIEARHEYEKASATEAKYKQLRILKILQKLQGQAQPKTKDSEVLRTLLAQLKNGQTLAHDRHDHAEAGVYALIIGQVEALLAETKGSSKEEP